MFEKINCSKFQFFVQAGTREVKWTRPMLIFFVSVLLITWPSRANACNGDCDKLAALLIAAPAAFLGTTIIFPLIGRALYSGENPPYWKAVGFTAVASAAGVGLAILRFDKTESPVAEMIGFTVALGSVATFLVYRFWPRSNDTASKAFNQHVPHIAFVTTNSNASIGLSWRF